MRYSVGFAGSSNRRQPEEESGTALGVGVRTLVVRLLGGEKRHYEEDRHFPP